MCCLQVSLVLSNFFCLFFFGGSHTYPETKGGGKSLREQGTGNREQGTCHVPQVFPEHVPEPLRERDNVPAFIDMVGQGLSREKAFVPGPGTKVIL